MVVDPGIEKPASIPVQDIVMSRLGVNSGISLSMARLDLFGAGVGGNKWFKLQPNIVAARAAGKDTVLSFGGAWSNHLHALAMFGQREGFKTIGIVRGDPGGELSATLHDVKKMGMQLEFVSRTEYRQRHEPRYIRELQNRFTNAFIVPEGGCNTTGALGCRDIIDLVAASGLPVDVVACACGTGTTMAGLVAAGRFPIVGYTVLRDQGSCARQVTALLSSLQVKNQVPWWIVDKYHAGGYARVSPELKSFIHTFEMETGIPLDPVYTGKLMHGLLMDIKAGCYPPQSRLIALHTGGLQGRRGFDFMADLPGVTSP